MAESDRRLEGNRKEEARAPFTLPTLLGVQAGPSPLGFMAPVPTGQVSPTPAVLMSSGWRQGLSSANTLTSLPLSLQPKGERPFMSH